MSIRKDAAGKFAALAGSPAAMWGARRFCGCSVCSVSVLRNQCCEIGAEKSVLRLTTGSGGFGYQPTATTMYCGLVTEMSADWPA
jgi:hypothetical protein